MSPYTLTVIIDDDWVTKMKKMKFNLCVAKEVNNTFTVVWSSKSAYSQENTFAWEEVYRVRTVKDFAGGESLLKKAKSNPQEIGFGQTVVRQFDTSLKKAEGEVNNKAASFTFENNGDACSVVVEHLVDGTFSTAWVDPDGMVNGKMILTPRPKVMVFFDKTLASQTMIATVTTPVAIVDFTGTTEKTVTFHESTLEPGVTKWSHGDKRKDHFTEPTPMGYSVYEGFTPVSGSYIEEESGDGSGETA